VSLAVLDTLFGWLSGGYLLLKVLVGFSIIIFVHELGHFLAAKWMGVRVDRFAIGFFTRVCGYRRGEGFTFGPRPHYKPEELVAKGYGETDYCLNILPFGGYVKMMGEDDILINEQTGEVRTSSDPRAFPNKPVGRRMVVVSAGVVFNLLFAVLVYAAVYLFLGRETIAPVVGQMDPRSPAAAAGLRPGDRVISIDGADVRSFEDIFRARMLAERPLRLRVARDGQMLEQPLILAPGVAEDIERARDLVPMYTTTLAAAENDAAGSPLRPGDRITHVDGVAVHSAYEILVAFQQSGGRPLVLTVERPASDRPEGLHVFSYTQPAILELLPVNDGPAGDPAVGDSEHLLGFRRRQRVDWVAPNSPAQRAGFRAGDVIARWGSVANPLYSEIVAGIRSAEGRPISVLVERDGQPIELSVVPRVSFSWWRPSEPKVGIRFRGEDGRPVVADIVPDSPAAELAIPRGAEILAVEERVTPDWHAVCEAFKVAAGTTVSLRYRVGAEEIVGDLRVPSSIVNELALPPAAQIRAIAGEDSVVLESGRKVSLPAELAVRKLLQKHVGQTVTVEFAVHMLARESRTRLFAVRPDNVDPWQLRAVYTYDLGLPFRPLTEKISAGGNPMRALVMGLERTGEELRNVYRILKSIVKGMVKRSGGVGPQHVSGPIGIVRLAVMQAESGLGDLLFFLALISVNLAVINFLPLPVVDGGLMVFLLLERIRGRPLNVKVQVITTMAGLALIVLVFVLVTFQDIAKWWGGGL